MSNCSDFETRALAAERGLHIADQMLVSRGHLLQSVMAERDALLKRCERLEAALRDALATIKDYIAYDHDGDPWEEDARAMGEMDINDYVRDGRMAEAEAALSPRAGEQHGE